VITSCTSFGPGMRFGLNFSAYCFRCHSNALVVIVTYMVAVVNTYSSDFVVTFMLTIVKVKLS